MDFTKAATAEEKWKIRAAEQQQTFHRVLKLKKWIKEYKMNMDLYLEESVVTQTSLAFYGKLYSECSKEEREGLNFVEKSIEAITDDDWDDFITIKLHYTYIITWNGIHDGIVPLVRLRIGKTWFIDTKGVYSSWEEYLKMNKLSDDLYICYPKDGLYEPRYTFVEVKYARCGSLRDPKKVVEEAGSLQPVPTVRFFPLYEPFFHVSFEVGSNDILITIKKLQDDEKPYTDAHSLAMWFKMLVPSYGEETIEQPDTSSFTIQRKRAQEAMEFFKLFYESPFSVHGFFVIVYLMKMIANRHVNSSNTAQEREIFSGMLELLTNNVIPPDLIDTFMLTLIEDYSFNNLFKFKSRKRSKEFSKRVTDYRKISRTLDLVAELKDYDHLRASAKIRKLINELDEIVRRNYSEEINASSIGNLVTTAVHRNFKDKVTSFVDELEIQQDAVWRNLSKRYRSNVIKTIFMKYTKLELDALLDCFKKIDGLICEKRKIKYKFLDLCIKFSSFVSRNDVSKRDVFRFMIGKFISKLTAFCVENAAVANTTQIDFVFNHFLVQFEHSSLLEELVEECVEMNRIFIKSDSFIYLFDYLGARVCAMKTNLLTEAYVNNCTTGVNAGIQITDLAFFFRSDPYLEMVRYYLDIGDYLPRHSDQFKDKRIWMHSKNKRFMLAVPFTPNSLEILLTADSVGFTGFVLMFEACPPPTEKR